MSHKNNVLTDDTHAFDNMFEHPLDIVDPILAGERQKLGLHVFRQRARRAYDDPRIRSALLVLFIANTTVMLTTPHSSDNGAYGTFASVVEVVTLAASIAEFAMYSFGHGVLPAAGNRKNAAVVSQLVAIFAAWSPPRLRFALSQYDTTTENKDTLQKPLLCNSVVVIEVLLVSLSILGYCVPSGRPISRLRYLHALRSLRLVDPSTTILPTALAIVRSFRYTMSLLASTAILLAFFFLVMGVMGVDQFMGHLSHRCVLVDPVLRINVSAYRSEELCLDSQRNIDQCVEALPPIFCAADSKKEAFLSTTVCHFPMVCRERQAPNFGYSNFDNIFSATLLMFHIVSLSNWCTLMYGMWADASRLLVGCYCVFLIIVASYLVLNLVTAVVTSSYAKAKDKIKGLSRMFVSRRRETLIEFFIKELVWWTFSSDLVRRFTFRSPVLGELKRIPFFKHQGFEVLSDLVILAVVVFNACNGAEVSSSYADVVKVVEIIYVIWFTLELVCSVLACGSFGRYLEDDWRKFEFFCFVLTVVGVSTGVPYSTVRAFRFVRHAKKLPFAKRSGVLKRAMTASRPSLVVAGFFVLALVVVTAVATQMFSAKQSAEYYDSVPVALITLFQVATVDNWELPLYDGMATINWFVGLLFYVPIYLFFGYILSSLFTAAIVDCFDPSSTDKLAWQEKEHEAALAAEAAAKAPKKKSGRMITVGSTVSTFTDKPLENVSFLSKVGEVKKAVPDKSLCLFGLSNRVRKLAMRMVLIPSDFEQRPQDANVKPPEMFGGIFQFIVMLFVVGSCVTAALQPASEACSTRDDTALSNGLRRWFAGLDIVFVVVFTLEMLLKMLVHGVFFAGTDRPWYVGPPYFRDGWNVLDFLLLVGMYLSFFYPQARAFRLFRTLRPLRVVRRAERLRVLINAIIRALPNIILTFVSTVLIVFIFSIIGVSLFKGKLDYCSASVIGAREVNRVGDCVGMVMNGYGVTTHAAWVLPVTHFDNVGSAMTFLIRVASLSGWTELMTMTLDVVGDDLQPKHHASLQYSIFFAIFVFLSAFIVFNIVVGVILVALDEQRGVLYMTTAQRDWHAIQQNMLQLKPIKQPKVSAYPRIMRLVRAKWFEWSVNIVVMLNIVTIASVHYKQAQVWTDLQYYAGIVFLCIFVTELVLKVVAFGRFFFVKPWEMFDGAIVVGSIVEFSIQLAQNSRGTTITSVARAVRVLRLLRSVKQLSSLRSLFHTIARSLPAILSIMCIVVVLLFLFSVFAMSTFGNTRFGNSLTHDSNFRSLDVAWFTLFRMMTLDDWDKLMDDVSNHVHPFCSADQKGLWYTDPKTNDVKDCGTLNDCSSVVSIGFFLSFYSIGAFLLVPIIIAVLLDNFNYMTAEARTRIRIEHLDSFRLCWLHAKRPEENCNYDVFIPRRLLSSLVIRLFQDCNPLVRNVRGVTMHPVLTATSRINYKKLVYEVEVAAKKRSPTDDGTCSFQEVLLACAHMQMGSQALTIRQRLERERFNEKCSLHILESRLRECARRLHERCERVHAGRILENASCTNSEIAAEIPPHMSSTPADGSEAPSANLPLFRSSIRGTKQVIPCGSTDVMEGSFAERPANKEVDDFRQEQQTELSVVECNNDENSTQKAMQEEQCECEEEKQLQRGIEALEYAAIVKRESV